MGADVKRVVQTDFIANGSRFSGPVQAMSSQASGLGSMLTSTVGIVGMLGGAVAGLGVGAALKGVAKLHSEFESTTLALGGMFAALGASKDFASGMKDAAATQKAITQAAAALPGEAEDYIAVFRAGLPSIQGAMGATIKDAYQFTNKFTAITSVLQIQSDQVARDLPRLLAAEKGAAGGHNITWTRMLPFIKTLPGAADMTATKFNNMSAAARGALLQQLVNGKQFTDMLDAAGNTWDSQIGALASNSRMIVREMTGPLFEGMKGGLKFVNDLFYTGTGEATQLTKTIITLGNIVSSRLVDSFKSAFVWAQKIGTSLVGVGEKIMQSPAFARLMGGATNMMDTAKQVFGDGGGIEAGGLAALGPLVGGLVDAFARPGLLESVVAPLGAAFSKLTQLIAPFQLAMGAAQGVFGDLFFAVLPPIARLFLDIIGPIVDFAGGLLAIGSYIFTTLRPALQSLWAAVGYVIDAVGTVLHNYLRLLGGAILWVFNRVKGPLMSVVGFMIKALTTLYNVIAVVVSKLGGELGKLADTLFGPEAADEGGGTDFLAGIKKALDDANKKGDAQANAEKAAARNTPAARGGGKTVQDFRNSRFDITQKFAEGYDPDRIAVAFAQDIGRIGEQRLQSGFEPAFVVH